MISETVCLHLGEYSSCILGAQCLLLTKANQILSLNLELKLLAGAHDVGEFLTFYVDNLLEKTKLGFKERRNAGYF